MNACASLSVFLFPSNAMRACRRSGKSRAAGFSLALGLLCAALVSTAGSAAQTPASAALPADGDASVSSAATIHAAPLPESPDVAPTAASFPDSVASDFVAPDAFQVPPNDAQNAKAGPNTVQSDRAPQTKRILGIIPNFRAISTDEKLPPQSVKDKFITSSEDSFDYSSIVIPAVLAGYSLGTNATPEFGHGGVGYGRYLWHAAVDQTSENYMVEFFLPVATHEDTRYYTMGRGGFMKRAGYSLSRVVITRSDSGREVFNLSEVVGAGASAGLSSLYYPSQERSLGNTGKEWGLDVGIDAAADVVKEFWPDINHWLFHAAKPAAPVQQ
jgi:hypothetical protein